MTTYLDYLKRIEGTYATSSFLELGDDIDEDDSLNTLERDSLKRYALNKHRCLNKINKLYEFKEGDYYVEYGEDFEGRFIAKVKTQEFTKADELIETQLATIMITPGTEIRTNSNSVGVFEGDELKVLIYPSGL